MSFISRSGAILKGNYRVRIIIEYMQYLKKESEASANPKTECA